MNPLKSRWTINGHHCLDDGHTLTILINAHSYTPRSCSIGTGSLQQPRPDCSDQDFTGHTPGPTNSLYKCILPPPATFQFHVLGRTGTLQPCHQGKRLAPVRQGHPHHKPGTHREHNQSASSHKSRPYPADAWQAPQ